MMAWLSTIYVLSAAGIAFIGSLGFITIWFFLRHRHDEFPCPDVVDDDLPFVTVQLPVFNERYVIERLIRSAANLDYPHNKLQIQVIDDSSDDSTLIAQKLVSQYKSAGLDISLIHRTNRQGYKAGALKNAHLLSKGSLVAVFDADFQPDPDFLRKTIPHFLEDKRLGMVQTRWGHLNPGDSLLTAAQSIGLDKHFVLEQTVRHRANLFPKFNGSAGVWRRECIEDAGGWQSDTVCEDLCLSTRAILRGWRFKFLNDVVAPAELPATVSAFKNQQARWAKGSTQCLVKFGPAIMGSGNQSFLARFYAISSMASYFAHVLLLLLLVVQVPLIYLGYRAPLVLLFFGIIGMAQPALFVMGQRELYRDWWKRLHHFPGLLFVAIGLAPATTRAIAQAIFGRNHVFVRTPKLDPGIVSRPPTRKEEKYRYRLPADWIVLVELFLAIYALLGLGLCIATGNTGPILFMLVSSIGLGSVAILSMREQL